MGNKVDWLGSPANIKVANNDEEHLGWKVHDRAKSLVCAHTLCTNYVTNRFLLASSSVWSKKLLCFLHSQGQKSEQKHTTKNFVRLHNHSPLLTMFSATAGVQHALC